jgi:hypothetical protein
MAVISDWIVGFFDIGRPRFWASPFLKDGFRHVIAFGYDIDKELWLVVDWGKTGLVSRILNNDEVDQLIAFIEANKGCFLSVKSRRARFKTPMMPCWCVTAIRHLLGVEEPLLTPYQLYCALRRRGGTPIFERPCQE